MIGTKIAHYEITSHLGSEGMGEVYRARDITLKRDVALKVLPADFSNNSERMARFQREAEVLASLDHPNIGHIHGICEAGGTRALALALVEGPTLAEQIAAGPISLGDTLAIARQVIDALEYAHERGVVHRDLKPANIKINPDASSNGLNGVLFAVRFDARRLEATGSPLAMLEGVARASFSAEAQLLTLTPAH